MIKIALALIFTATLLVAGSVDRFAQKYAYETDYKTALKKAKAQKKPILLIQVSNYCPWCKKLEKKTLGSKKVNALVQKNYIPLILNRDKNEYPKQFSTPIVPVSFIINYKDDTKYELLRGYQNKSDYLHFLN